MLDALRHPKAAPPAREGTPDRGAAAHGVPAPLARAFGQKPPEEGASTGKRLALAVVLVAVTALLLWQVAAMNDLVPAGPLSKLLTPAAADRMLPAPAHKAPSPGMPPPAEVARAAAGRTDETPAPPTAAQSAPAPPTPQTAAPETPRAAKPTVPRSGAEPAAPEQAQRQAAGPASPAAAPSAPPAAKSGSGMVATPWRPAGETDHFKLALYYQRVGDFENALIHYLAVIAADELNAEAHNNLGVLYQGKSLYDEAIKEFQRATFIDPRYDKAHNNLGVALLRSGKTDAAIVEFRGIVSRDPRNVDALTNLALALKAAGRAEEARESLQRVLTINGRYAQAHYNLALLYEERGEWQRAIEHFEQFLVNAGSENAALTVEVRTRVQALRTRLQ